MTTKVLVVLGPTASGKSDLAVTLAQKFNGEIISADSRQVYEGLNIGTGKITASETKGVPHYMLDVVSPKKVFSVAEYKNHAESAIRYCFLRDKLPIIVGGTGMYIDTLLRTIVLPDVGPNKELRKKLEKKTAGELFLMLKKLDPNRAKKIDGKNKVRLVRAIEIAKAIGPAPKTWRQKSPYDVCYIGLNPKDLEKRIHARFLARIRQGMIVEATKLHKAGVPWSRMETLGLEYRYVSRHLRGLITKKEMVSQLEREIRKYAKRQMTWFKTNKDIEWFDPTVKSSRGKILKHVKTFVAESP